MEILFWGSIGSSTIGTKSAAGCKNNNPQKDLVMWNIDVEMMGYPGGGSRWYDPDKGVFLEKCIWRKIRNVKECGKTLKKNKKLEIQNVQEWMLILLFLMHY